MKVSEVMTTEVETVQISSTLEEAASIMKMENIGAVPVVDEDDDLVGIITDRDIVVRCVADGKNPAETSVEEVLSHDLETIEADVDVEEAARLMADRQIRRLPVCDRGELVGMLSIGDLAVKSSDNGASAEALREISQGVRHEGKAMPASSAAAADLIRGAHEGGSRAAHAVASGFSDDEDLDLEFSDDKDLALSDARERHPNRHRQGAPAAKRSAGAQKILHAISEAQAKPERRPPGQKKEGPGQPGEEAAQGSSRVIAFRQDGKPGKSGGVRKTG